MNINSNYRVVLHPFLVPIICFRMFHANDETCTMFEVINQITEQNKARPERDEKDFGTETDNEANKAEFCVSI